MSLTLLPEYAIPLIWNMYLKTPPPSGDLEVDAKARAFASYVDETWISGSSFPPSLWSHFSSTGPRTTNVAEGWHNSLNSQFGMPHPSLRSFMDWLQKCQYAI